MTGLAMTRRKLLAALLLAPPALAACSTARSLQATAPDPLIALAAAARSDAALAAAVIAATPNLAGRLAPLRDARTAHATALEAGVAQQAGATTAPQALEPAPAPSTAPATLAALRTAVAAAGDAAAKVAMTADVHRAGLIASVAACCTTYAAVLG